MRFVRRLYVEFHAEASLGMFNGFGEGMRLVDPECSEGLKRSHAMSRRHTTDSSVYIHTVDKLVRFVGDRPARAKRI